MAQQGSLGLQMPNPAWKYPASTDIRGKRDYLLMQERVAIIAVLPVRR